MLVLLFINTAVNSVPGAISSGIATGTLEALFSTRTPVPAVIIGLVGYGFVWSALRAALLLAAGLVFGLHVAWSSSLGALVVLALIVLAYLPFGLLGAAMVLAFRTAGPLSSFVLILSGILGGVYYPTSVIPSWIRHLSDFIPLTYGLRALRQLLLEGVPFSAVSGDVLTLVGFAVFLMAVSLLALTEALHYARRTGTLAQY
jgi:ABC-2 type transport system permease protein